MPSTGAVESLYFVDDLVALGASIIRRHSSRPDFYEGHYCFSFVKIIDCRIDPFWRRSMLWLYRSVRESSARLWDWNGLKVGVEFLGVRLGWLGRKGSLGLCLGCYGEKRAFVPLFLILGVLGLLALSRAALVQLRRRD